MPDRLDHHDRMDHVARRLRVMRVQTGNHWLVLAGVLSFGCDLTWPETTGTTTTGGSTATGGPTCEPVETCNQQLEKLCPQGCKPTNNQDARCCGSGEICDWSTTRDAYLACCGCSSADFTLVLGEPNFVVCEATDDCCVIVDNDQHGSRVHCLGGHCEIDCRTAAGCPKEIRCEAGSTCFLRCGDNQDCNYKVPTGNAYVQRSANAGPVEGEKSCPGTETWFRVGSEDCAPQESFPELCNICPLLTDCGSGGTGGTGGG